MYTRYQTAPSKAVEELIGTSRHCLCITKAIKNHRKICLSSHSCHFVNNNFLSNILLHAYVKYVYIMYTRYPIAPSKAVVGVDRHIKAIKNHRKICLSSHSCHFVNNNFLSYIPLHAYVQYVYIMYTRYPIAPSKAVVGVDRHIKALSMHIQMTLRITKGNNSNRIRP